MHLFQDGEGDVGKNRVKGLPFIGISYRGRMKVSKAKKGRRHKQQSPGRERKIPLLKRTSMRSGEGGTPRRRKRVRKKGKVSKGLSSSKICGEEGESVQQT